MDSKIVSFQIAPPHETESSFYFPTVIALCEDGSMWIKSVGNPSKTAENKWYRMTPENTVSNNFMKA